MMPRSRILVVDDEPSVTDALLMILADLGHRVDSAKNVGEATALLKGSPYDLVFTDLRLPDGSGIEIATEAHRRGIPAIIVTAYAFRLPKDELARFELLLKPVRPAELLQAVEGALKE